jgi:hypothetical protein
MKSVCYGTHQFISAPSGLVDFVFKLTGFTVFPRLNRRLEMLIFVLQTEFL